MNSDADESDHSTQKGILDGARLLLIHVDGAHVHVGIALLLEAADDVEREESSHDMSVQSTPMQSPMSVEMVPPFAYKPVEYGSTPEFVRHYYELPYQTHAFF